MQMDAANLAVDSIFSVIENSYAMAYQWYNFLIDTHNIFTVKRRFFVNVDFDAVIDLIVQWVLF